MARGITESDVHTAADELVTAGERPTVERVRAHLGTGSPNTVVRWLETWWRTLGQRLYADRNARMAIADVPSEVAELAGKWWMLALEHARTLATRELATERAILLEARQELDRAREVLTNKTASLLAKTEASAAAEQLASTRSQELERLVQHLQGQVSEITDQRDAATGRARALEEARESQSRLMQSQAETARSERNRLSEHVRATEDRAHAEIDRARQEAKDLRAQIASLTKRNERALVELAEARRDLATQQARADALEAHLTKVLDLPKALKAALDRQANAPVKKPRSARTRRPTVPKKIVDQ